jgi:SnoaL-like domain
MGAENAHDLAGTLATLTADGVFTDTALGRTFHGHDGAAAYYRMWWDAFEVEVSPEDLHWTTAGLAVAEARFRGGRSIHFSACRRRAV